MTNGSTFGSVNLGAALPEDAMDIDALKAHVIALARSGALARRASDAVKAEVAKSAPAHPTRKARTAT